MILRDDAFLILLLKIQEDSYIWLFFFATFFKWMGGI